VNQRKKLPIGIQSFRKIIEGNYIYVDKTRFIHRLVTEGQLYFLSRPRRFGKSVLISTLEALFRGERELFEGCYIIDHWDWQPRPVIRLDLLGIDSFRLENLEARINSKLERQANDNGLRLPEGDSAERLSHLIESLAQEKRVVVLIDEYDKPILDHIDDPEVRTRNQKFLASFYGVLKSLEDKLEFVMLTGVSKFTRVSVFSDLNNLNDITLHPQYGSITGYTEEDLDNTFAAFLEDGIDGLRGIALREKIRLWYNGYSWNGTTRVYNPVSLLNLFDQRRFAAYWFSTGTPKFLIDLFRRQQLEASELGSLEISELSLEGFAPDKVDLVSMLFQTGYLTIKKRLDTPLGSTYQMGFPNREVEQSFLTHILASYASGDPGHLGVKMWKLGKHLANRDLDSFCEGLCGLFASIPYNIFIEDREAYYHTVIYLALTLSGVRVIGEVQTNKGRIDAVIETDDHIYVLEFKLGVAREALDQIAEKGYVAAYRDRGKQVIAVGIGLDPEQRNIGDWRCEPESGA